MAVAVVDDPPFQSFQLVFAYVCRKRGGHCEVVEAEEVTVDAALVVVVTSPPLFHLPQPQLLQRALADGVHS